MRIVITGATGFIGSRLCFALAERGDEIVAITRDAVRARLALPPNVEVVVWNPREGGAVDLGVRDVDALVHLAGESISGRWSEERKRAIHDSRITSTRNLVNWLEIQGNTPRVLVSGSAIGYYGDRGDESLDENSPSGEGFLAGLCAAWEAEAVRAESFGVRVVRIRTGLVLSPFGGVLKAMLMPYRLGLGGPMGSGRQWMSWIHLDDEVGLILHAIDREEVQGALNATAPEPVTNNQFARSLGAALRRPAVVPVPGFALRLALGQAVEMVLGSQRVLPARALATGYRFRYASLASALAGCLRS